MIKRCVSWQLICTRLLDAEAICTSLDENGFDQLGNGLILVVLQAMFCTRFLRVESFENTRCVLA